MRILVLSDSHRSAAALQRAACAQPQADMLLHLGDGESEFEQLSYIYPDKRLYSVAGNCDWGSPSPAFDLVEYGGRRIFFCHGHTFGVKAGLGHLIRAARAQGADIALYGHTHIAYTGYEDGLYLMNPGSVAMPRSGPASYGIVDITPAGIVTGIVPLHQGREERKR